MKHELRGRDELEMDTITNCAEQAKTSEGEFLFLSDGVEVL